MDNFLQSDMWRKFQEAVGHQTLRLAGEGFRGNGIVHELPLAGKYVYFPRGPILRIENQEFRIENLATEITKATKEKNAKWIRIEPGSEEELAEYKKIFEKKLVKAPHDVQPREVLVMDIAPEEDTLIQKMKSKTRYNIRLAEKKGVRVFATREKKYQEAFLDLMKLTAARKEITPHPQSHYAHFFSTLPPENLFLFVAEYQEKVLAANLLVLSGDMATYLHGGSSDEHRDLMAPYLLQWEQIRFAKQKGCVQYDMGGVKTQPFLTSNISSPTSWMGITRFKQGFAPNTAPTVFPGTYDIVLDKWAYFLYNQLSRLRGFVVKFQR